MTDPTIELSKDLEAWYEFDTRNFDNQRNVMADLSGYGRHAEASGGPTVGVNGPASFEATSLDGSDDYFDSGISPDSDAFTMVALAKADDWTIDTESEAIVGSQENSNNTDGWIYISGEVRTYIEDSGSILGGSGSLQAGNLNPEDGEWALVALRADVSEAFMELWIDGEIADSASDDSYSHSFSATPTVAFGNSNNNDHLSGDIAWGAYWTRNLTKAEMMVLADMSGPRRAML